MNAERVGTRLAVVLLSATLLVTGGCGRGGQPSAISHLPAPQVLRGTGADPLQLDIDKRFGAIAVQLRLEDETHQGLEVKALPSTAAKVEVTLSGGSLPSPINVTVYSEEFTNNVAQFVVTNLPSGTITVSATVKDSANATLASGSQSVTVVVGQVTPVNLLLSTSSATGSGSVSLLVDTRPSATPSPSASVPAAPTTPANGTLTAMVSSNLGPQLVLMDPTVGPVGTNVTISGTGFGQAPGLSTVTFNGTAATLFTQPAADANATAVWKMDDASGSTATATPTSLNGTTTGTTIVTGRMNRARRFNGTSDYVSVAANAALDLTTALSVEAWVYPTALPGSGSYAYILSKNGASGYQLRLNSDGSLWGGVNGVTAQGGVVRLNQWTYVTMTADSAGVKLYINGVQAVSNSTAISPVAGGALYLGTADTTTGFFSGTLDEIRLSNTARAASAITSHWDANKKWSDVQIVVPVPTGATTGPVKVQVGNLISNVINFSVQ